MASRDVAVFVGSLRAGSLTRKVANALITLAPASMDLRIVEIDELPLYNPDLEENVPEPWVAFRREVSDANALLLVTPRVQPLRAWRTQERDRCRVAPVRRERVGRQTGSYCQRLSGEARRVRREPPAKAVARLRERPDHATAGGIHQQRRRSIRRCRQPCGGAHQHAPDRLHPGVCDLDRPKRDRVALINRGSE